MMLVFIFNLLWLRFGEALPASISHNHTLCDKYIDGIARKTNVPPAILWAVAYTESNLGHFGPWPWSVNVHGHGYYFKSQTEMLNFLNKKTKTHHSLNIDIGCMQLNLFYHGSKFDNIEEMTDIYKNMLVASQYLRQLYEMNKKEHSKLSENRVWGYTVGDYHSRRPLRSAKYINRVSKFLKTYPAKHNNTSNANTDLSESKNDK